MPKRRPYKHWNLTQEFFDALEKTVPDESRQEFQELKRKFQEGLEEVRPEEIAELFGVNPRTVRRWGTGFYSQPKFRFSQATLSTDDLKYVLQISRKLNGPMSLSTILDLVRLRKTS